MVVDLERHAAVAASALGNPGLIGAPSLPAAAIEGDLDGTIPRERAPEVLVELLLVARDHEELLGDTHVALVAVVASLGAVLPRRPDHPDRGLIQEFRQRGPRVSAARRAR